MGTDKDTKTNYTHIFEKNDLITIRQCSLEDLEGVIQVNEKELPED